MLFKDLLQILEQNGTNADSFRTPGQAMRRERATADSPDKKARDAARKREERARKTPRSQKSKEELIKEVIPVKTSSGRIQLIFKDSFNKEYHTKIGESETLSIEQARTFINDPKFEQTGASKLLFGNIREKKGQKKETKGAVGPEKDSEEEKAASSEEKEARGDIEKKPAAPKPKKLSKEEIFGLMSQMSPEQIAELPVELRQEYFKQTRNPPANTDFDTISFEALTNKFAINDTSTTPYNQQVLNAIVFLAKVKSGANEQELLTYSAISPGALDFTKIAFLQAKKILSQIGDQCIQNLVSSIESGNKTTFSEGDVDMECGNYRFKISAGGEFTMTTDKFDQNSKTFRGVIANSLFAAFNNPNILNDDKVKETLSNISNVSKNFSKFLINRESFDIIKANPELENQLKSLQIYDDGGNSLGAIIDSDGNLNKFASFEEYKKNISKGSTNLFKNSKKNKSEFVDTFVQNALKTYYRGDGIKDPNLSPNHLVTQNGIFSLTDDYFSEIAKTATVSVKPASSILSLSNITPRSDKSNELMKKYSTIIEQKENKKLSIKDLFIDKSKINTLELLLKDISDNMDFDINVSLLPGFSPNDLNVIQYNYVRIGNKTIKIPVDRSDSFSPIFAEQKEFILNDILIESLTNNFVLNNLIKLNLLTYEESEMLRETKFLNEDSNYLKYAYNKILYLLENNSNLLIPLLNSYNKFLYEKYVRDYKKEYKNYHGKTKQKKDRAKRTKAREQMIKKGRVKRGDGKDIDHKKALRNGGSNGINNLRVRSKSANRADNGHKKGEKQNKNWK